MKEDGRRGRERGGGEEGWRGSGREELGCRLGKKMAPSCLFFFIYLFILLAWHGYESDCTPLDVGSFHLKWVKLYKLYIILVNMVYTHIYTFTNTY